MVTRRELVRDLHALGLTTGDLVMVHASVRSVGPILGGVNVLAAALLDAVGPSGTLAAYVDWEAGFDERFDASLADDVPAFDKRIARAARAHGILAEVIRTWPGAIRSDNPDAGVAAIGADAAWLCADHALSYGYGPNSPFAKFVSRNGKIAVIGAPLDTMTILHHAEHIAQIGQKRIKRYARKVIENGIERWAQIEEFETSQPVVAGMPDDHFTQIAQHALAHGIGRRGRAGAAESYLFGARELVDVAVRWLEAWCAGTLRQDESPAP